MPIPAGTVTQLTPVLIVDAVEPCLAFWTGRFGFRKENEVPGPDGKILFASVTNRAEGEVAGGNGLVEIMYQTRASVLEAEPESSRADRARELGGHSVALFIHVKDIDALERAVAGAPVVKPRHETFYGTTEIYVKEPGGNTIGFAARLP